jgi:hypothetical protein
MQFFERGPDGMLHQRGAERLRRDWIDKRLKAHEKAQKAARARWSKHKAKQQAKSESMAKTDDAPSIARAILEQCPISLEEQEQKQIQDLALIPSAARRQMGVNAPSIDAASTHAPIRRESLRRAGRSPRQAGTSPRQVGKSPRQLGVSPRQAGTSLRQVGKSPRQLGVSPRQLESAKASAASSISAEHRPGGAEPIKREDKEKTRERGAVGVAGGSDRGYQHQQHVDAVAAARKIVAPGAQNGVRPSKADPRQKPFQDEILRYWAGQNPEHPKIDFRPADDRALDDLLEHNRELTVQEFRRLLINRANSEVNPSALPYKWLRNILEYASGPLGPFSKPLARSRSV